MPKAGLLPTSRLLTSDALQTRDDRVTCHPFVLGDSAQD
jgi:hypothetical protein